MHRKASTRHRSYPDGPISNGTQQEKSSLFKIRNVYGYLFAAASP